MKINGEPVERVASMSDLRPGVTVYYAPCRWCGKDWHRMMVLDAIGIVTGMIPTGEDGVKSSGWLCIPRLPCEPSRQFVLTPISVAKGMIYRVVDPLLDRGTATAKRKPVEAKT